MSPDSVAFDRAAEYYDATRVFPEKSLRLLNAMLTEILAPLGRCLEIGIGTGRIALPLIANGVDVVGIDISEPMVAKLNAKATQPVPVAIADASALPFADGSFDAALGIHVLHLMGGWDRAARELARVVRPGGAIVFDLGGADVDRPSGWGGIAREIEHRLLDEAGIPRHRNLPGLRSTSALDDVLAGLGYAGEDLPPITGTMALAPRVFIDLFQYGSFSWTWSLAEDTRVQAANATRAWATERFGDLDDAREVETTIVLRVYRPSPS